MDKQGHGSCQYQSHSNCAACGVAILRRTTHAHVFRERGRFCDEICERCWLISITAATAFLTALHKEGMIPRDFRDLWDWLDEGRVCVLIQSAMPGISAN